MLLENIYNFWAKKFLSATDRTIRTNRKDRGKQKIVFLLKMDGRNQKLTTKQERIEFSVRFFGCF